MLSNHTHAQGYYQTPENPDFKIFYLEHGNAAIDSFAPEPRKTYEF
jgi:uncharacterized pyridoxamine 5'-phosphate oxidase family protein